MRTKELNINKAMRTGVILAVIAIIALIALVVTFAKYATQGTGQDEARVARWGVNSSVPTDLNLFDASYTGTGGKTTVDASDGANVIAPGTSRLQTINLASFTGNQAPEVMYHFEPTLAIVDQSTTSAQTISLLDKLNQDKSFTWQLVCADSTTNSYQTYQELQSAVAALGQKDIAPNTFPTSFIGSATPQIKIGWTWGFDGADQSDTELGNLVAAGNLKSLKTTLTINAYQCQGCSSSFVKLYGTVKGNAGTVDGATVTYTTITSNGTYTAITDENGDYSMQVPKNSTGSLKAEKSGYGTVTYSSIQVGETDTKHDVTNFDPTLIEIDIPEGIDASYSGSSQIGVVAGTGYTLSEPTRGASIVDGNAVATDAGDYSVKATLLTGYAWKGGSTESKTIEWTIAKAENPMEFPDQSDTSSVVSDQSVAYTFNAATGAPEGSSVTYAASSSASSQDNFYIPDHSNNVLVCAENTGADTYTITLTATASETDNYKEGKVKKSFKWTVNYKPIQSVLDCSGASYTVNFLPAISDASWADAYDKGENIKFYEKVGEAYNELDCSSMSSLATAIANIDTSKTPRENAAKVYTDATNATFYGTIDRSWNNTFYLETAEAGYAEGLNSEFKTIIDNAGVKTVYGDYVDGVWQIDRAHNWDANDNARTTSIEPDLGDVGYNSFCDAYCTDSFSLLSSYAYKLWSSRSGSKTNAFIWFVEEESSWQYDGRGDTDNAVVLSRAF